MPTTNSSSAIPSDSYLCRLAAHKRPTWFTSQGEKHPQAEFVGLACDIAAGTALAVEMIHSSWLELQAMQDGDEAALPALNAADAETLLRFVAAAAHGLRRAAEAQIECINGNV